jgi:membrane associated rhomboid family serine protease
MVWLMKDPSWYDWGVNRWRSGRDDKTHDPPEREATGPIRRSPDGKRSQLLPVAVAPVSIAILIACLAVFVRYNLLLGDVPLGLTFSPGSGYLFPGLIAHMFTHAHALHLLFNMLLLYFLGVWVERTYGTWRYAALYFGTGVFAALAQAFVLPHAYLLGASGALSGVMAAFVRHFPHARLYIWGILPIPAWLAGLLWVAYNIVGVDLGGASTAFMAHLAGFASGIVLSLVLVPPRSVSR